LRGFSGDLDDQSAGFRQRSCAPKFESSVRNTRTVDLQRRHRETTPKNDGVAPGLFIVHFIKFNYVVSRGRRSPKLEVHFRSQAEYAGTNAPPSISVSRRKKTSTPWSRAFPTHFTLSDENSVIDAARFLFDVAYPLSIKATRARRDDVLISQRPAESIPEELLATQTYHEGATTSIVVNRYERNLEAHCGRPQSK
jgi:hypothetical protein